jgi:hypothetical protein
LFGFDEESGELEQGHLEGEEAEEVSSFVNELDTEFDEEGVAAGGALVEDERQLEVLHQDPCATTKPDEEGQEKEERKCGSVLRVAVRQMGEVPWPRAFFE